MDATQPSEFAHGIPATLTHVFEDSPVKSVTRDGEPWFVAATIAKALGIKNIRNATSLLDEDEVDIVSLMGSRGRQDYTIVSESGLYTLIFRSKKKEAKDFRRWVTSVVLPQLRKSSALVANVTILRQLQTLQLQVEELMLNRPVARTNNVVSLRALPSPQEFPPPSSTPQATLESVTADRVKQWARARYGEDVSVDHYKEAWYLVNRSFCRIYHIDLGRRKKNKKKYGSRASRVTVARDLGMLQQLYDVICRELPLERGNE